MAWTLSRVLLLVAAAASPSQAAIAAWWNGIGPQVVLQNTTTDSIRHTKCNTYGTTYYSHTDASDLPLIYKPKKSTPLAGTGYWTDVTTIASVFYIEEGNGIAQALLECDMETGLFKSQGNWIVSDQAQPIHKNSGLAIVLLGDVLGYRVYYHDEDMVVNELKYTKSGDWEWLGPISQHPPLSPAITSIFSGKNNITVVTARDERNFETVRLGADDTWRITTLPHPLEGNVTTHETDASSIAINETAVANFTLEGWTGKPGAVGISIDKQYTRFLWYIGNDSSLNQISSKDWVWRPLERQPNTTWPKADTPNAEFGLLSQFGNSMVRAYYFVGGRLAEIKYENGSWKPWAAIAEPKPLAANDPPNQPESSPESPPPLAASGDTGLSEGAKAGIGVGVGLGVIALGALGTAIFLLRRRRAASEPQPQPATLDPPAPGYIVPEYRPNSAAYDQYMTEKRAMQFEGQEPQPYGYSPAYSVAQLESPVKPAELYVAPTYELPVHSFTHEMGAGEQQYQQQYQYQQQSQQTPYTPDSPALGIDPSQQQQQHLLQIQPQSQPHQRQ